MLTEIASGSVCELAVDFVFSASEHEQLYRSFSEITANPYHEYDRFNKQVQSLIDSATLLTPFVDFCNAQRTIDRDEKPFVFIKNCPIDKKLPVFDFEKPLKHQHALRETFIAEAFLATYAFLVGTPLISYAGIGGERFSDVHPQKYLQSVPCGANLGHLYIHKELTDHKATPDYVNILALRNYLENQVYTTFIPNQAALQLLDEKTRAELRKAQFCTLYSSNAQLQEEDECYPILFDDVNLRYIEKYTRGLCEKAQLAVEQLNKALHTVKKRVLMMPGDFVSTCNIAGLHGKEVHKVADEEQLKIRWLIKTLNVNSLEAYAPHFLKDRYGIVDDKSDVLSITSKLKRGCEVPSYP